MNKVGVKVLLLFIIIIMKCVISRDSLRGSIYWQLTDTCRIDIFRHKEIVIRCHMFLLNDDYQWRIQGEDGEMHPPTGGPAYRDFLSVMYESQT